jgi:hypothetical protein
VEEVEQVQLMVEQVDQEVVVQAQDHQDQMLVEQELQIEAVEVEQELDLTEHQPAVRESLS